MATKKLQPAVRYLRYELTNSATPLTETSHFIDLAKDLSAINRRLYRQGRHYYVKRVTVISANTPNSTDGAENRISFSTCPTSWVATQAWKRGMKTYMAMNKRATRNVEGDVSGTWQDFKVYLSTDHRNGTKLTPKDNGGNDVAAGEWIYSRYLSPDGTTGADEFDAVLLGDHVGAAGARVSVGLIKSYGEARATVQFGDPSVSASVSDDPLVNLFDSGTEVDEIVNRLESDNDTPPYDHANYPGDDANMPKPLVVQDTTIVDGKATVGGFTAMCGLIEIEAKSPIAGDIYSVLVELAPGSYRGIKGDVIE
jgi:hypothetical protein